MRYNGVMTPELLIVCFAALFTKHFVFDFLLQGPFQFLNKGTYGHPGGILHAGLQAIGTFVVLGFFVGPVVSFTLGVLDGVVHYHIDWAKTRLNDYLSLQPNNEKFWWLLGLDQYLHYMTYAFLLGALVF